MKGIYNKNGHKIFKNCSIWMLKAKEFYLKKFPWNLQTHFRLGCSPRIFAHHNVWLGETPPRMLTAATAMHLPDLTKWISYKVHTIAIGKRKYFVSIPIYSQTDADFATIRLFLFDPFLKWLMSHSPSLIPRSRSSNYYGNTHERRHQSRGEGGLQKDDLT